jgi:DNA-binding XRE family transcriptional regulator
LAITIPRIYHKQNGYPELPKKIGEHIRKHRMDLKLFQEDVANIIGVSECTVYNWEKRGHEPEIKHIPKIIKFLGYVPFDCPGDVMGKLSYFKKIKGFSFLELGKLLGRDPDLLSSWLSHYKKPYPRNLDDINRFLSKHWL